MTHPTSSLSRVASALCLLVFVAPTGCNDASSNDGGSGGATSSASTASTTIAASTTASTSGATSSASSSGSSMQPDCVAERTTALGPIDAVTTGEVTTLSTVDGATTLYVDASAGGTMAQNMNPWVYLNLTTGTRVDLTDLQADTSTAWDLAIKRPLLRTNGGDGGYAGLGGAGRTPIAFDDLDPSDIPVPLPIEEWFTDPCVLKSDMGNKIRTTFADWYDYAAAVLTPKNERWIVRSGDGTKHFKLEILGYYTDPDGEPGMTSGRYEIRFAQLSP